MKIYEEVDLCSVDLWCPDVTGVGSYYVRCGVRVESRIWRLKCCILNSGVTNIKFWYENIWISEYLLPYVLSFKVAITVFQDQCVFKVTKIALCRTICFCQTTTNYFCHTFFFSSWSSIYFLLRHLNLRVGAQ